MIGQQVVALQARETGQNSPHEFVIAAVDELGRLHQWGGVDPDIAAEVVGIIREGESLVLEGRRREALEEERGAMERGDTPDMPRHTQEARPKRYGAATPAGEPQPEPQGMGQKPVAE
jgi:hypothetical protein